MQTVTVALGERSYPIYVGRGALDEVGQLLGALKVTRKTLVVTQPAIRALYGDRVIQRLRAHGFEAEVFEVLDAEEAKSLAWLEKVYDRLVALRLDRRSPLIALGGGVVGDLAGFAAATYLRGIPFVQIPTTLLAQVDSSIGGKTAVNHPRGKNLIGAFYQPRLVLIDVDTLHTLPPRDLRSGLGEVVKYSVISSPGLFQLLEEHATDVLCGDPDLLSGVIEECCRIKAEVVSADEHEGGLRAILNFGHTFGHAIEAATDFSTYTHGEAVAIGMIWATELSRRMGLCAPSLLERLRALLVALGLPTTLSGPTQGIREALSLDKKVVGGRSRFVLVESLGKVSVRDDVPTEMVEDLLRREGPAGPVEQGEVPIRAR